MIVVKMIFEVELWRWNKYCRAAQIND